MKKLFLIPLVILLASCGQGATRIWGGTTEIKLPPKTKLVTATWKANDIWYLYRPMRDGETSETSIFQESSQMGMMEGKVIFIESK